MCFLCQFSSRTCTAKEKFCQGKEKVKDVAVLMDIEPSGDHDGGNLANEAAPTAKSIKNTHSGPVRMARDNYLPWLEPETLELPPDLISITYLTLFGPCPSPTVGGSLVTQKSESHMNAVYTAFSNCRSFQNPSDDTSPILSSIKTSHAPNRSK